MLGESLEKFLLLFLLEGVTLAASAMVLLFRLLGDTALKPQAAPPAHAAGFRHL